MHSLNDLLTFVHAAEQQSFVAAGRVLGISASAVGKSIARLEARLGTRLLQRTTRRVALTEEGALFHARCRRILDDLHDAEAMLSDAGGQPRGRLRISAPTIGYRFLLPVIPAFRARYPEIALDIDFNDRLVDLVEDGLDAVIRSGPLEDSSLLSRPLAPFRFVLCAAPAYLARRGRPDTPGALEQHDCLRFRFPNSGKLQTWQLADAAGVDPFRGPAPLTCNNMEALHGAAVAGLGIAYMPDFLARDSLASGALSTLLDAHLRHRGQFSILWPSSRQLAPRLRVFVDFLVTALSHEGGDQGSARATNIPTK